MSKTEDKKKLTVLENVSVRMSNPSPCNFAIFSLTITALDQTWEPLCVILKKQLGISSCQVAPFGASQKLENTDPLPSYPVYCYSPKTAILTLRFFTEETLENPVRATRVPNYSHITCGELNLAALLPLCKHPMQHQTRGVGGGLNNNSNNNNGIE